MARRRAFVDDDRLAHADVGARLTLPQDVAHRFSRVLRLADGARVELFDDDGHVVVGVLAGDAIVVDDAAVTDDGLPPLIVLQAVTKADKLELVVQKGAELGASEVVLFPAHRSQVNLSGKKAYSKGGDDDERADKKLERLERIGQDASRQCLRARPPSVRAVKTLDDAVAVARAVIDAGGLAVCGITDAEDTLSGLLVKHPERVQGGVVVIVGPEGGLDDEEERAFVAAGVSAVRWSRFVLRTETAALAALAVIQAALGEA